MTESQDVLAKAALSALGLVVVLLGAWLRSAAWQRRRRWALGALAALSAAAYVNFGTFHGHGLFAHSWEQFHYFLGAKYFPEVGYDGLYVASMGAEMQGHPEGQFQPFLRDLRTNEVVPTATLADVGFEVHRRFSPERWAEFRRDNAFFMRMDPDYVAKMRMDHGYNPSPAWTAVARTLATRLEASEDTANLLGALDLLLLALAFWVLFRTYGFELGTVALLVFGTGYAWRWFWTGGGFLRQDWLVATVIAVCMLERRRFVLAGALLAYAAMVRIFPAAFLFGPAVLFVRDLVRGSDWRWFARLAAGFALGVVVLLAAGSTTGRGTHAWAEFAANLGKHRKTWLTNNVGLANVVLYGNETYRRQLVDWTQPEPWLAWQARMDLLARERRPATLALAGLLLLLAGLAVWREGEPDQAAAVGVAVVFALVLLTCYYWGMLLVTLLRRTRSTAAGLLALSLVLTGVHFASEAYEVRYGVMSWALLAFFVVWLWPLWRRGPTAARASGRSRGGRRAASSRP